MLLGLMGGGGGRGWGRRGGSDDALKKTKPLKITDRRMLGWFYTSIAREHWPKIALGVFCMITSASLGLYVPMVMKSIFDDVIQDGRRDLLAGLVYQLLMYQAGSQVLGAARTTIMHLLGQRLVHVLRMQCFSHLVTLGMSYFERERTGDIMSRVSNDVQAVENLVVHATDDMISNIIRVVGTVGFMFYLSWKLAMVALAPLPIFVGCLLIFSHYIRPVFRKIRDELGDINVKLQERISGMLIIKSFAREEDEVRSFEQSSGEYWRANSKSIWMWSTFFPFVSLITSVGMVIMIWYGAELTTTDSRFSSPGTIVAFLAYLQQFYGPVGSLMRVYNTVLNALASMARIFELLDEVPDVADKPDAVELGRVEGAVNIENVSFRYATGENVLQGVSVSAEPGEMVAIVGRSGAGKTTLVNLIPRFYDPYEGRVLIDGHDVRDVTQKSLRRNIGIVLQDTFLFNDTVRNNIRYACPDADDERIIEAAKAAHAHDFISELDEGYDTVVGERGVKLSGGQKQRISIARALLADPRILILDEATSSVDTEAEQIIQRALMNLQVGRTTFVIAHRLSTIRRADKIVVIDEGEIVEQADHESLMARNGLYKEMYTRQFQIEEDWNSASTGLGGGISGPPAGNGPPM
ncbi:MAG: ABC transporter ATP-binding protein [Armatimonadetes bacterium]|nr:ABC transporter ATP-binding protein [Armatimonadota bacterium]